MSVLYAALFAHLLGDFVFQSDHLVDDKRRLRIRAHLKHGGTITTATFLLVGLASHGTDLLLCAGLALSVGLLHTVQDAFKDRLSSRRHVETASCAWIVGDQLLHLAAIGVLAALFGFVQPLPTVSRWLELLHHAVPWEAATVVVVGTWTAGILLREALKPFVPLSSSHLTLPSEPGASHATQAEVAAANAVEVPQSTLFTRASFWIGIVERVVVIASVASAGNGGLATAGLVVAAKSIFRWRALELDPNATQYFLLGTLASIAIAVADGLVLRNVLR